MSDIEFVKEVAQKMSSIERREIMETNSKNFLDLVDKTANYLFRLSHQYLKENGVKVDWIEQEIKSKNDWARKEKEEKTKKYIEENYISDGFGNYWNPICDKCGKKSIEIVRPGKVQCVNVLCSIS